MTVHAENIVPMAPKPSVAHTSVTPDMARRWLAGNSVNRTLREGRVNQYAADMVAGRWTLSNDALCFAPDGRLLNGQHRLNAVVKAGVPVVMLVARNMPEEAMTTMDSGAARTAADALRFAGEINTNILAATARIALLYTDGRIYKDRKVQGVSHSEIVRFLDANPLLRHSVSFVTNHKNRIDCPPSPIAVAHWIIATSNNGVAVADHFVDQLASRTNEPQGSAILALDSRFRQLRRHRIRPTHRELLGLLIKGWNYYARDARVASLALSTDGRIPKPVKWQR